MSTLVGTWAGSSVSATGRLSACAHAQRQESPSLLSSQQSCGARIVVPSLDTEAADAWQGGKSGADAPTSRAAVASCGGGLPMTGAGIAIAMLACSSTASASSRCRAKRSSGGKTGGIGGSLAANGPGLNGEGSGENKKVGIRQEKPYGDPR